MLANRSFDSLTIDNYTFTCSVLSHLMTCFLQNKYRCIQYIIEVSFLCIASAICFTNCILCPFHGLSKGLPKCLTLSAYVLDTHLSLYLFKFFTQASDRWNWVGLPLHRYNWHYLHDVQWQSAYSISHHMVWTLVTTTQFFQQPTSTHNKLEHQFKPAPTNKLGNPPIIS